MMEDRVFDSNISRLMYHASNIIERKNPINLSVSVTSRCNLKCNFCYIKNRKVDEIDLDTLINFISIVKPASIDIVGGEPFLYSKLDELTAFMVCSDIPFGLITNGVAMKSDIVNRSLWTRVSANAYIDEGFIEKELLNTEELLETHVAYGYNYVYTGERNNNDLISRLSEFSDKHPRSQYLRISPDVNRRHDHMFNVHYNKFNPIIQNVYKKKFISFDKSPPKCYMGRLKPLIEPDGFVYRCSAEVAEWFPKVPICSLTNPEMFLAYSYQGHQCEYCHHYVINKFLQHVFDQCHTDFI